MHACRSTLEDPTADVVRIDKGHTEGLEPEITEEIVTLMTKAKGGKIASAAR